MANENKDLMELLDKLKKMQPASSETANEEPEKGAPEQEDLNDLLPPKPAVGSKAAGKKDEKAASKKSPRRPSALTTEIYSKITELEKEIKEKEEEINFDLTKIAELVEAIGKREEELAANEETVAQKDDELTKQLEDMKKIRSELQKVLR